MPRPGYINLKVTDSDRGALSRIAEALERPLDTHAAITSTLHEALRLYAVFLAAPRCPDCGTDLVPQLDDWGAPTGHWFCPGCSKGYGIYLGYKGAQNVKR